MRGKLQVILPPLPFAPFKVPNRRACTVLWAGKWEFVVSCHGNYLLANHPEKEEVFREKSNDPRGGTKLDR